jgi:hypothetical protein
MIAPMTLIILLHFLQEIVLSIDIFTSILQDIKISMTFKGHFEIGFIVLQNELNSLCYDNECSVVK